MWKMMTGGMVVWMSMITFAQADTITVNVTGRAIETPCIVDTGSVSQNVDFGQLRSTDLKVVGAVSDWVPFEVKLVSCPKGVTSATVTFSGIPSNADASLYANTGTATNIAVQVANIANNNEVMGTGSKMTVPVDSQASATYKLAGRLKSPIGDTGPGTIIGVVQMNFSYQ